MAYRIISRQECLKNWRQIILFVLWRRSICVEPEFLMDTLFMQTRLNQPISLPTDTSSLGDAARCHVSFFCNWPQWRRLWALFGVASIAAASTFSSGKHRLATERFCRWKPFSHRVDRKSLFCRWHLCGGYMVTNYKSSGGGADNGSTVGTPR